MSKCRTIDRLALTKKSTRLLTSNEEHVQQHGDICPKCGQHTLHFMEGCETCVACGWSACGIDR